MAGLPKSIIKKYGVSKKAWAVYRGGRARKSAGVNSMAKKRRKGSRSRGFGRSMGGDFAVMAGAALYGAGRSYVSNRLAPITAKVPLGDLSDEAVMLGVSYLLWKKKIPVLNKVDLLSKVGFAGVVIESARIGEYAIQQTMPQVTNSSIIYN